MPESTFEVYYEQVVMGANGNIRRGGTIAHEDNESKKRLCITWLCDVLGLSIVGMSPLEMCLVKVE